MKKIFLTILVSSVVFSCNDRLEEMNTPKKDAANASAHTLFSSGLKSMFDMMASTSVNDNVFRLYSQYWAQTTYPDESQYNMVTRNLPDNVWRNAYRDVLKDLDESAKKVEETANILGLTEAEKANQLAVINICKIYTYAVLVDAFGAVPYTEALDADNLAPAYEKGADVYAAIITELDAAIAALSVADGGFSEAQDFVYQGDAAAWKRFANSLKLRLAITIHDVDPTKANLMTTQAVAGGLILTNAQNARLEYEAASPNTNPVWEDLVQGGRTDFVVANTFVDKLLALNDPRIAIFAEKVKNKNYIGGEYGSGNSYDDHSHIGKLFHEPNLEGIIFDASETHFLLAEAAERSIGGLTPADAEEFYNNAIKLSFEYWKVDGVDDYLANPDIAYTTAAGSWKQKIGTQQWIAYYNRGFEGWTLWRRLDFTGFNIPDGMTFDDIPRRLIFPITEATLNGEELKTAIALIGGTDNVQTRVFWDKQ